MAPLHDRLRRRGGGCRPFRALARESLLLERRGVPPELRAHAEACPACGEEVAELARMEQALAGACRSARERIAPPSAERVESILLLASAPRPEARVLGSIRRTVNRMLLLTLLLLSVLPLAYLAWLLFSLLVSRHGG